MPFVRVEINRKVNNEISQNVITQITEAIHLNKGDQKPMISVVVNTNVNVGFGGDYEKPAAIVQVLSLKMPVEITTKLTESISDILRKNFNVAANRMYIFFQEFTQMHLVGWNRKTFAEIVGGDDLEALEAARKKAEEKKRATNQ